MSDRSKGNFVEHKSQIRSPSYLVFCYPPYRIPNDTERIPNDTERYPKHKQEHKQEQEQKQEQKQEPTMQTKEEKNADAKSVTVSDSVSVKKMKKMKKRY